MPQTWKVDDFTEGGLASVVEFVGRLNDIEEDVEGLYGTQDEIHFVDCELIEAGEDVTLEEGRFTTWIKQSNKKNSVAGKMVAAWAEFASAHDLDVDDIPNCLMNGLMRWKKVTYEFGDDMSPGRAFVPVEIIEEGGKKAAKKVTGKKATSKPAPPPEDDDDDDAEVPEILVKAIHDTIGEDGATKAMIQRTIKQKAELRKALADYDGDLSAVLDAMPSIEEDDGSYTRVEDDDGGDEDPV